APASGGARRRDSCSLGRARRDRARAGAVRAGARELRRARSLEPTGLELGLARVGARARRARRLPALRGARDRGPPGLARAPGRRAAPRGRWHATPRRLGRDGALALVSVRGQRAAHARDHRPYASRAHRRRLARQLRHGFTESPAARARAARVLGRPDAGRPCAVTKSGARGHRVPPFFVAVLTAYFTRAAAGAVTALPLVFGVAASGAERLESDRALFAPGALLLVELLRTGAPTLLASAGSTLVVVPFGLALTLPATALLFVTANTPEAPLGQALPRALRVLPAFVAFGLLELALGVVAVVIGALVAVGVLGLSPLGALAEGLLALACLAAGLVLAAAAGMALDLARAAAVPSAMPLRRALRSASATLRRALAPAAGGYALATGASALLVAVGARGAELLEVERDGAARWVAVVALHQGVLALLAVIQGLWVLRATALVAAGAQTTPGSPRT